jgi:NADH-quinone oxidoreductase subunit C
MSDATPTGGAETPDDEVAGEQVPTGPELLHGAPVIDAQGQRVAFVGRDDLVAFISALADDGYLSCLDVAGVDYLTFGRRTAAEGDILSAPRPLPEGIEPGRFEVVYELINHRERARLRVRVQVPEDDPTVPSLYELHPGTEAPEREAYDMFGITFTGHPDLTRILMPEDWIGHPLRKDYSSGRIPVQFKAAPSSR